MNEWMTERMKDQRMHVICGSVTYPRSVAVAKRRAMSDRLNTAYLKNEKQIIGGRGRIRVIRRMIRTRNLTLSFTHSLIHSLTHTLTHMYIHTNTLSLYPSLTT